MKVLVTGGAGYIGSHTVLALLAGEHDVAIVDDFSNSKRSVIGRLESLSGKSIRCHRFDLTDWAATDDLFDAEQVDAVVHFAGYKAVGESVARPLDYYVNNLGTTFALLNAAARHDVTRFVFSSSATVYGDAPVPYHEDHQPLHAASPYGWTKFVNERIFRDVAPAQRLKVALLRYFNPVGAHPSGLIGEDPQGIPNNLMPFISQVAIGRRPILEVFGHDYPTADGTCERDYIHVEDLARGHVAALDHLEHQTDAVRAFNLGGGSGTSVLELVRAFEAAAGRPIPYRVVGRRPGDLPAYWADATRARDELGWVARNSIHDMCADTWRWQQQNPNGYPD